MTNVVLFLKLLFVLYAAEVEGITVKPCPTNKIAPHRRSPRFDHAQTRTFGHFYSLFMDEQSIGPGGLQEQPQADEPDDCGDIEDYDENDLSSVTNQQKKQGQGNKRFFLGPFNFIHNNKYTTLPPSPVHYRPTRPPPGGYFGTNAYRPPLHHNPTDNLKPVHEHGYEPEMIYRPGIVGVPLNHVVGMRQIKPTRHLSEETTTKYKLHPHSSTQPTKSHRQPKTRNTNENGVLRSFIDLLF